MMRDTIGKIECMQAVGDTVFITGRVAKNYANQPLQVYELLGRELPENLLMTMPLQVVSAKDNAFLFAVPLANGVTRRLRSFFVVCAGKEPIAPPKQIENYREFFENPYAFAIEGEKPCSAVGDGSTDNTEVIEAALQGGGRVVLKAPGCYLVSSTLHLEDNAELSIEAGATLFSCDEENPIISAAHGKNIKLTGGGEIRVPGTRCASAVFYDCEHIEISDVTFVGAAVASLELLACRNVCVCGVLMENAGLVCGKGTENVSIFACSYHGKKDGLIIGETENICVCDSVFCASGGTGLRLQPKGAQMKDISVSGNVFQGDSAVLLTGDGFVHRLYMRNNLYLSLCRAHGVQMTSSQTDCGIQSEKRFVNHAFSDGLLGWSTEGEVLLDGKVCIRDGALWQGLFLKKNQFSFSAEVQGEGSLFIQNAQGELLCEEAFTTDTFRKIVLKGQLPETGLYNLGVRGNASVACMQCLY